MEPVWCDITYSAKINDVAVEAVISFDSDPTLRTFSFHNEVEIALAGTSSKDYVVNVIGSAGSVDQISTEATFTLTINNPCADKEFVNFSEMSAIPTKYYTLYQITPN